MLKSKRNQYHHNGLCVNLKKKNFPSKDSILNETNLSLKKFNLKVKNILLLNQASKN